MHYAILFLDTRRRIRIYNDGAITREESVQDLGWAMMADDTPAWDDEPFAWKELERICSGHCKR